jgi:hypothetical protein
VQLLAGFESRPHPALDGGSARIGADQHDQQAAVDENGH